jgi:Nuclease-related domain
MLSDSRWKTITESEFVWERNALEFLRKHLPDRAPYRAWTNFEFVADNGKVYEVDALILAPRGLFRRRPLSYVVTEDPPDRLASDSSG